MSERTRRAFSTVAWIEESRCVGCARCLEVCPVDAIVGARNRMHTVIAAECIGCRLCLEPCPVDCIVMKPTPAGLKPETAQERSHRGRLAKARHRARRERLEKRAEKKRDRLQVRKKALLQRRGS